MSDRSRAPDEEGGSAGPFAAGERRDRPVDRNPFVDVTHADYTDRLPDPPTVDGDRVAEVRLNRLTGRLRLVRWEEFEVRTGRRETDDQPFEFEESP